MHSVEKQPVHVSGFEFAKSPRRLAVNILNGVQLRDEHYPRRRARWITVVGQPRQRVRSRIIVVDASLDPGYGVLRNSEVGLDRIQTACRWITIFGKGIAIDAVLLQPSHGALEPFQRTRPAGLQTIAR